MSCERAIDEAARPGARFETCETTRSRRSGVLWRRLAGGMLMRSLVAAAGVRAGLAQRRQLQGAAAGGGLDGQVRQLEAPLPRPARGGDAAPAPAAEVCRGGRRKARSRRSRSPFRSSSGPIAKLAADIADVIAADLERRVCSGRSTAPRSWSRCGTSTPRRAFPTGARSRPTRSSSATSASGADGRIVAEFRLWDVAAGRQLAGQRFATSGAELAPCRPHHRRSGLRAADRREGLLRHARRLRRRDRAQGAPHQAARDHGPGRRQRAPAEQGPGAGADAALHPDEPRNHLHVLCRRPAARVPDEPRDRASARPSAIFPA